MHVETLSSRTASRQETPYPKGHVPIRMCVICRKRFPKQEITRYTCPLESSAGLCLDVEGKRPGRGFYVCTSSECMNKFKKFKGWQKKCRGKHNGH